MSKKNDQVEPKKKIVRKPRTKPKLGRPPIYDPEYGAFVCDRIATTNLSVNKLCKMDDMPSSKVFWQWMFREPDFKHKYLIAKEAQQHLIMEELDDIYKNDIGTYVDAQGNVRIDAPSATLIAKKIEHKRWYAARLASKNYGDKQTIETVDKTKDEVRERLLKLEAELNEKHKRDY